MKKKYHNIREAVRTGYCLMKKELDNIKPTNDYNRRCRNKLELQIQLLQRAYDFDNEGEPT